MIYKNRRVAEVAKMLKKQLQQTEDKQSVLKSPELRGLYAEIATLPVNDRAGFGKEINQLKAELEKLVANQKTDAEKLVPIDVTAPVDINVAPGKQPVILPSDQGSRHPIMTEIKLISDIFYRMGFNIESSRQIDDEYHMFDSLNFPKGHPARDDYDTFVTTEGLIAPAHTSTMQNRVMQKYKSNLEKGDPIAVLIPDRVFRNEDLDPRHEHTFYQHEGVYISKGMNVGHLLATLKTFLSEY